MKDGIGIIIIIIIMIIIIQHIHQSALYHKMVKPKAGGNVDQVDDGAGLDLRRRFLSAV